MESAPAAVSMHPESKNCERSSELASTPRLITSQLIMSQPIERMGGVVQIELEHMEPQDSLTEEDQHRSHESAGNGSPEAIQLTNVRLESSLTCDQHHSKP